MNNLCKCGMSASIVTDGATGNPKYWCRECYDKEHPGEICNGIFKMLESLTPEQVDDLRNGKSISGVIDEK